MSHRLLSLIDLFLSKSDNSIELAGTIEVAIDDEFPQDDRLQQTVVMLAMYRPGGGEYLYDYEQIAQELRRILQYMKTPE